MECYYIRQNDVKCKCKATQELLMKDSNIINYYCTRHYNILIKQNTNTNTNANANNNETDNEKLIEINRYDNIIIYKNKSQNYIYKYLDISKFKNILQYEYLLFTKIFLHHENIIKFINYEIKKNISFTLKLEYLPLSFDEIKLLKLTEVQIKNIGCQLIKVIQYIHSNKYLYINLVPLNIRGIVQNNNIIIKIINLNSCIKYINNNSQFYDNNILDKRQGNDIYSSRNINLGYRGIRLDDIENILYILLDLINDINFNKIKNLKQITRIIKKKNEILITQTNYEYINNYINEINNYINFSDINENLSNKQINYNKFLNTLK